MFILLFVLVSKNGRTALHWASHERQISFVTTLLHHGASTEVIDKNGRKPIDLATSDTIRKLLLDASKKSLYSNRYFGGYNNQKYSINVIEGNYIFCEEYDVENQYMLINTINSKHKIRSAVPNIDEYNHKEYSSIV